MEENKSGSANNSCRENEEIAKALETQVPISKEPAIVPISNTTRLELQVPVAIATLFEQGVPIASTVQYESIDTTAAVQQDIPVAAEHMSEQELPVVPTANFEQITFEALNSLEQNVPIVNEKTKEKEETNATAGVVETQGGINENKRLQRELTCALCTCARTNILDRENNIATAEILERQTTLANENRLEQEYSLPRANNLERAEPLESLNKLEQKVTLETSNATSDILEIQSSIVKSITVEQEIPIAAEIQLAQEPAGDTETTLAQEKPILTTAMLEHEVAVPSSTGLNDTEERPEQQSTKSIKVATDSNLAALKAAPLILIHRPSLIIAKESTIMPRPFRIFSNLPSPKSVVIPSENSPESLFFLALAKVNNSALSLPLQVECLQSRVQSAIRGSEGNDVKDLPELSPPDSVISAPPSYTFVLRQIARRRPRLMGTFIPSPSFILHTPPPNYGAAFDVYIDNRVAQPPPRIYNFGFVPMPAVCHECGHGGLTVTRSRITMCTHLSAIFLCLFCCWLCVPLPYILSSCKDVYHYCANCRTFLGIYCPTNPPTVQ